MNQIVWKCMAVAALAMAGRAQGMATRQVLDAATLHVTGRDMVINGIAEVPRGLFSVHAAPLTPEIVEAWGVEGVRLMHHRPSGVPGTSPAPFVLDCFFDRYQPATCLARPDWEEYLRDIARRHGEALRVLGTGAHAVEFWNEPYLNWATKPGVNYDGIFYDLDAAVEGAPMTTRHGGETLTNLVWDAQRTVAVRRPAGTPPTEEELRRLEREGTVDYLATRFMPTAAAPGSMFQWRDLSYVAVRRWWGRDRSQPSWWSGTVNREYYLRMATAVAQELESACPDAPLVVGWGFHLFESNWRAWDLLHRPTLDALSPWVDGYGEHHYGVDPRRVAASYEIADAYMRSRWGRRIGFWNTEAGGMQDPERPDVLRPLPEGNQPGEARGAAAYFLRDILTLLRHVPDKARMRCAHEPQVNSGVPAAFKLLKPLRGALVETRGPDDGVWSVAARTANRLTVVCYNGTAKERNESLEILAPRGTKLGGLTRRRMVELGGVLDVEESSQPCPANRWRGDVALGAGAAEVLVFALEGEARPAVVRSEQFVGDVILQEVAAGKPATFRVLLPEAARSAARRATVRWVIAGANAPLRVRCDGVALEADVTAGPFREAPVDLLALGPEAVIEFNADGWESTLIGTASILLETEAMPR